MDGPRNVWMHRGPNLFRRIEYALRDLIADPSVFRILDAHDVTCIRDPVEEETSARRRKCGDGFPDVVPLRRQPLLEFKVLPLTSRA